MRRILRYASVMLVIMAAFSAGNYLCYRSALKHFEQMQEDTQNEINDNIKILVTDQVEETYQAEKEKAEEQESVSAGSTEDKLNIETIYQVESYDVQTEATTTTYETLPEALVGADKEKAMEYCKKYMNNLSADEFLLGLQSMGVVTFSAERVVVRKIYDSSKIEYKYYLISIDDEVVVYYGDKKNIYEYTGITTSSLDIKEQKALKNGVEVRDEDELFAILENYSS